MAGINGARDIAMLPSPVTKKYEILITIDLDHSL